MKKREKRFLTVIKMSRTVNKKTSIVIIGLIYILFKEFYTILFFLKLESHSLMRVFAFEWVRLQFFFLLFMSFFLCVDLFLLWHKNSSSFFFVVYLSVSRIVRCWRQILDEFRFRCQCVSSIILAHTQF